MKRFIKLVVQECAKGFAKVNNKNFLGRVFNEEYLQEFLGFTHTVKYKGSDFKFYVPNLLNRFRAFTFSKKEPETLDWIDSIGENSVLWDVGANVGLYSIYAAQERNCKVWAFEPSVFNLELLAKNIFLNDLVDNICIVPLALTSSLGDNRMHMTTTQWGGALSSFGEKFGWDGKPVKDLFEFRTIGLNMVEAVELLKIPLPDYIKIDVDGIEHLILQGGEKILKQVKGVLIEVNDDFKEQKDKCEEILSKVNLSLLAKEQSDIVADSNAGFQNTFNQIWVRE